MVGGILKLTLFLNVLFLSITLWQAATVDTSPTLAINDNLAKSIDDISQLSTNNNYYRGEPVVKHSLHSTVSQKSLIDGSPFRSRLRLRRLRKKLLHSIKLKKLTNHFQSTGTYNKNLQDSKPIQAIIDDRLKRFRMLDPDEFQEMLNSLSPQIPDEQIKDFNNMDKIDGMQLENYWSRK